MREDIGGRVRADAGADATRNEWDPEWQRAHDRMLESRTGALTSEAAQARETGRLHKVAQWWKEKFPLKTKLAIGAGFLTAGLLGNAAVAGIVGAGALAWRAVASGFTGVAAAAATNKFMTGRNYSKDSTTLWTALAGTFTGLFSFFGGKAVADYFSTPTVEVPASRPSIVYVEPGSGMTFEKLMSKQLFAAGGPLADLPLSPASRTQLLSAIDHTFRHNPDHCNRLFSIEAGNPAFPEYEAMMRNVVRDGIQLNFSGRVAMFPGLLADNTFINDLKYRIARDYPTLSRELNKSWANFDVIATRMQTGYAPR